MLYYNFKLAFRNLWRHRTFSIINILGLSIGLACTVIIGLYAYTELSFDQFNTNHAQIFRINKFTNEKGKQSQQDGITPGPLAPEIVGQVPEVAAAARFRPWFNEMLVSYDSMHLKLDDVAYADQSFLSMFDFPLISGNKKTALSEPYTAVITEAAAKKYFRNDNPIGKTLITLNNIPVKISGVAKDVPYNSSVQFTMLISWPTIEAPASNGYFSWMSSWTTNVNFSFVQLKPNTNPADVGNKISALLHGHFPEKEFQYRTYLQPLDDIHLGSADVQYADAFHTNSSKIIYTLLIIAGFILLIACFNFINLTTAGALGRAKETGVQKVLGARQFQVIKKFFSESFVLCLFSMAIALFIVSIAMPLFNQLANTRIDADLLFQWKTVLALTALLLLISFIAGLYPAIFLSRFRSTDVFRNVIKAGKDSWVRKALVTTQFALSVLLIIATIVVNNQMHYLGTKDLGFDREQVVVLQLTNTGMEAKCREFSNALKQNPNIISVSSSNTVPGQGFNGYGIIPEGHSINEHLLSSVIETDANFTSTYNIQLAQGRYFSASMPTDTTDAIVINEAMARYLGWTNAVGKQFEIYEARKGKVIGVMKDFNFASLRQTVQPLAIMLTNNPLYLSVKLKPATVQSSLDYMQKQWKQFNQEYPFDYTFLDDKLNRYYQSDIRLLHVLNIFAGLAIFIACIGLFGLSIYTAKQRTKEIGIRKVLGASVRQMALLVSEDFIKLVAIAVLIASPVAWWAADKWLQDFAYRINIEWWIFMVAGIAALFIALLTVSFQAIKAAMENPVKSLRTE